MPQPQDQLANLRIAAPCPTTWETMAGDERVRHCSLCNLNVYNFAELTADEVRLLLARSEGRVCARLYRRADGTVLTRDCPTGLRALRRRASRTAVAVIAALLSLPAMAFGGMTGKKPRIKANGSKVRLQIERVTTPQAAVFAGVVRDRDRNPIPGVTIDVEDEITNRLLTAVTDADGAFTVASLADGLYRVRVTLSGFKPVTIDHLQLQASEVTRATVTLRLEVGQTITVGAIAVNPTDSISSSTTFTQDFINKLPM
ncbi:MAG TPA: carboxypeptidase-like regulatory domain-containing protein [Thermoanaerobaculia bacterium]|jgi:hypothetical protein